MASKADTGVGNRCHPPILAVEQTGHEPAQCRFVFDEQHMPTGAGARGSRASRNESRTSVPTSGGLAIVTAPHAARYLSTARRPSPLPPSRWFRGEERLNTLLHQLGATAGAAVAQLDAPHIAPAGPAAAWRQAAVAALRHAVRSVTTPPSGIASRAFTVRLSRAWELVGIHQCRAAGSTERELQPNARSATWRMVRRSPGSPGDAVRIQRGRPSRGARASRRRTMVPRRRRWPGSLSDRPAFRNRSTDAPARNPPPR